MKIENKVSLVTGAASGIGRAVAGELAKRVRKAVILGGSKRFGFRGG